MPWKKIRVGNVPGPVSAVPTADTPVKTGPYGDRVAR